MAQKVAMVAAVTAVIKKPSGITSQPFAAITNRGYSYGIRVFPTSPSRQDQAINAL